MSIYDVFSGGNKPYDKAEWAAQKQAERKEAYELIDATCSQMAMGGDSFRQYLDVQVDRPVPPSSREPTYGLLSNLPSLAALTASKTATSMPLNTEVMIFEQ